LHGDKVEVSLRNKALLDSVTTTPVTPRVERLRQWFREQEYKVAIDQIRIDTRVMRETVGEPMELRRGKVFAAIVREMPISIFADELIVGCAGDNPLYRSLDPEDLEGISAGSDVTTIPSYSYIKHNLGDEDLKEINEDIAPYWKGEGRWERTRRGRNYKVLEYATLPLHSEYGFVRGYQIGHNSLGYEKVLKKGFLGVKKDAEERLARLDTSDPEEAKKVPFLQGVIYSMEGAAEIGMRFAALARGMAESEEDAKRKGELLKIAEVCDWVPANPARTFREALQSIFFARMLVMWETPHTVSHSVGRIERFTNHYYENDLESGILTKEETQELLDCFIVKLNHTGHGNHVGVGGVKANGQDATCDLSYMLLEAMAHVRLVEPFMSIMIHGKTPDALLIKGCRLLSLGTGAPVFINNDVQVEQMMARPIPLEHARAVTQVGCYEPVIAGYDAGTLANGLLNFAEILELALTNGYHRLSNEKLGIETGDPRRFKSFEQLKEAIQRQTAHRLKDIMAVNDVVEDTFAELCPTTYESALIEDCIEKGISREKGGARYNFAPLVTGTGAVDAGNSLAAIKQLVFDEGKITMGELCDALEKNFEGYDDMRLMLLKVPKFGNDIDSVDEQVAWVSHVFAEEVTKCRNNRGGYATPIGAPMQMYVHAGAVTGALPSGRFAEEPLSDAWSPAVGTDVKGPTAIFKSMGKIDHVELLSGVTLNMRLAPEIMKDEDGVRRTVDLMRTFVDQKVFMVQTNVVSSETLKAAQKDPEEFRDVIVKVAGYSAYFVQLPEALQEGIIARTEHAL
jgi:formate C-acetyltransferase